MSVYRDMIEELREERDDWEARADAAVKRGDELEARLAWVKDAVRDVVNANDMHDQGPSMATARTWKQRVQALLEALDSAPDGVRVTVEEGWNWNTMTSAGKVSLGERFKPGDTLLLVRVEG